MPRLPVSGMFRKYGVSSGYLPYWRARSYRPCFAGMAFRAATCPSGDWWLQHVVSQAPRFEQLLTHTYRGMRELLFYRYGVSSSYLPYVGLPEMMLSFGSMAFRVVTYNIFVVTPAHQCFESMAFRAVTYFANNLSGRNGVSQVWRFGQLLSNRPLICGSCAVLQIWRSKQLLTSCAAERFFELVLQV